MNTKKVTRFKLHHFQIFVASKPNDSKDSKIPTSQHQIWQKQIVELRSHVWRLLTGTGSLFITVLLFMAMKKWGIQLSTLRQAEIRWKKTCFSPKISGIFNVLSGKSYRYDGLMCLLFCWRFIKCPGFSSQY